MTDSSLRSNDGANNGCLQVTLGQQAARQMKCQPYVRLNTGFISLNGNHFHGKPRFAVTMATWLKLSWLPGRHEIFSTIGGKESTHTWGQYHFEVIQGKVRWFHRNEKKTTVFSVVTPAIIQANKWTHIAGKCIRIVLDIQPLYCIYITLKKRDEIYNLDIIFKGFCFDNT